MGFINYNFTGHKFSQILPAGRPKLEQGEI